jgi:hypothetical protein
VQYVHLLQVMVGSFVNTVMSLRVPYKTDALTS